MDMTTTPVHHKCINRKRHSERFQMISHDDIHEMARQSKKPTIQFCFMLSWHPDEIISPEKLVERNRDIGSEMSLRQAYQIFKWLEEHGRLRRIRQRNKGKLMKARYELWEEAYGWRQIATEDFCKNMQVDKSSPLPEKTGENTDLATCTNLQVATVYIDRVYHSSKKQEVAARPFIDNDSIKAEAVGTGIPKSKIKYGLDKFGPEYTLEAIRLAKTGDRSVPGYFNFLIEQERSSVLAAMMRRRDEIKKHEREKRKISEALAAQNEALGMRSISVYGFAEGAARMRAKIREKRSQGKMV